MGPLKGSLMPQVWSRGLTVPKCVYGEPRFACVGSLGKTHLQLLMRGPLHSLMLKTPTPEIQQLSFLANRHGVERPEVPAVLSHHPRTT